MCIGGAFGFAGAYAYENAVADPNAFLCAIIAVGVAFIAGAIAGAVYTFLTATLLVNQNVVGLTLTIFGVGVGKFFGTYVIPEGAVTTKALFANKVFIAKVPVLHKLGVIGDLFFSYGFMVYVAIIVAIILHLFLTRSRAGLNLRAVGENPATADAAGINVAIVNSKTRVQHLRYNELNIPVLISSKFSGIALQDCSMGHKILLEFCHCFNLLFI